MKSILTAKERKAVLKARNKEKRMSKHYDKVAGNYKPLTKKKRKPGSGIGSKGGGRKMGNPNRKARSLALAAHRANMTPLSYMLDVLKSNTSTARKDHMAVSAAPYVHPKLSATKVTGAGDDGAVKLEHKVIVNYVMPDKKVEE